MERILVTGGAGFIGSHIVDSLVLKGYEVVVLDNLSTGRISNLKSHLKSGSIRFIQGDVRDSSIVRKSINGSDAVVHLAAITSVTQSIKKPSVVNDVNVSGTLNVLKASLQSRVKRFVYVSTTAVYGDSLPPVKEDMLPKPLSPYGASKLAGEHYCLSIWKTFGLPIIILRYFNVYGRRMVTNGYAPVISSFVRCMKNNGSILIYGDGEQTRDFIHVSDAVEAVLLGLKAERSGEIFNIGTGKPTSINQLAQLLIDLTGKEIRVKRKEARAGEVRHSHANASKATQELGFLPKVDLRKGLEEILS